MTAAELVSHAAVSFASGRHITNSQASPLDIVAQIERIYRGIYLLSTLKREKMLRERRRKRLKRSGTDILESQSLLQELASD